MFQVTNFRMEILKPCFVVPMFFLLLFPDSVTTARTIYIDSDNGTDAVDCGNATSPCRNLDVAWSRFIWSKNVSSHVTFLLEPGNYYVDSSLHYVLSYTCSEDRVSTLDIIAKNNR